MERASWKAVFQLPDGAPVIAQDRRALARQHRVMTRFGHPQFTSGPGDMLGARLHQLWVGKALEAGREPPVEATL